MSDVEYDKCNVCGKKAMLQRKYYHYNIECECCGGVHHFEIIRYCDNCSPKEPEQIRVILKAGFYKIS